MKINPANCGVLFFLECAEEKREGGEMRRREGFKILTTSPIVHVTITQIDNKKNFQFPSRLPASSPSRFPLKKAPHQRGFQVELIVYDLGNRNTIIEIHILYGI
jgi:hypothetical protein